jgi:glycosyltransferase involved in cell wall biosynthesis
MSAIKHSILVICFNQEKLIRYALDSVLEEKVKPYEIIIADDCSTDGTRSILQEYELNYPDIVKLILNHKNLGIFDNLNIIVKHASGDMVSILAGDDWYEPGFLAKINSKVEIEGLDPRKEKFMILPNMLLSKSDGSFEICVNEESKIRQYSLKGALLRGMLNSRDVAISKALFDFWPQYPSDVVDVGLWSDLPHTFLFYNFVDKLFFINDIGPVYRIGSGVTSRETQSEMNRSFYVALQKILNYVNEKKVDLDLIDVNFLKLKILSAKLRFQWDFYDFFKFIFHSFSHVVFFNKDIRYVVAELFLIFKSAVSKILVIFKFK